MAKARRHDLTRRKLNCWIAGFKNCGRIADKGLVAEFRTRSFEGSREKTKIVLVSEVKLRRRLVKDVNAIS